jgi:hypothetical protein
MHVGDKFDGIIVECRIRKPDLYRTSVIFLELEWPGVSSLHR